MFRILVALSLSCSAAAMHVNNSVINKTFNDEAGESLREFTEADNITTNWEFDRTERGCKCNATWYTAGIVGDCYNEAGKITSVNFDGCGMQLPCDGDNNANHTIYSSWCFTQDGCGKLSAEEQNPWDFCHPPLTTTVTATTTTNRFKTQRGCECLDQWGTNCVGSTMKDGTPGGQQQQFYRCGMDIPCDGDDNRLEKNFEMKSAFPTWCFVSPDCLEGIETPDTQDRYDYCTPLGDFYGSSTETTITTSTVSTTTVTTIAVDQLAETFAFMGNLPYWYFFVFVGAFFVLIIIVICVFKRHCVSSSTPHYNPEGRNYAQTDETTFSAFDNAGPAASANTGRRSIGSAPPPTPRSAMPLPGGGGGGGASKVATMKPGSIAPGAASAFDTENTTYALVHEMMEIEHVETFMEPKTSGYAFLAPDAAGMDPSSFNNSFAHDGEPPDYELLFEGQHPAEIIEGLHDYEYGEQQLKEAANVHDTTAEGSGRAGGGQNLYADIHPGHGVEGNQAPAASAYLDDSDDDEETFPAETDFGVPESTLPRSAGSMKDSNPPTRQLTDNTAESRTSETLNTDLAAANPFGDSADVTEGDGGGADGGGADGEGSGDDEYEVETPLTNDLTDFDEAAAPPIPQRPESAVLDAEDGVIGADGGMSL